MSSRRKVPAVAVGPTDFNVDELITVQPPVINHLIRQGLNNGTSRSSDNKADDARKEKRVRDKERDVGPARKKSRKDSGPDERRTKEKNTPGDRKSKKQLQKKGDVVLGAKPVCYASGEEKVVAVGGRVDSRLANHPILGDVAKAKFENSFANYRIPKISQRHPLDPQSCDPQLALLKPTPAEKRKMDVMDNGNVVEPQRKKTNTFDLRKLLTIPSVVIPTPALWRERRHVAVQRGRGHRDHKDRAHYDFIPKQEYYRNSINDGHHPHRNMEREFHFQRREMPPRFLVGNDPRLRFGGYPVGAHPGPSADGLGRRPMQRFDMIEPPRGNRVLNEEQSSCKTLCAVNIGQLLSKLVDTGLLPASAPEAMKPARPKEETKKEEAINRVVDFSNIECMKVRPNDLISMLYSGKQCGSCGLRFPADKINGYRAHLDWHFQQNRIKKNELIARLNKQCGSCGLQFTADQIDQYSAHLDWHFKQNRKKNKQYHWSQSCGTTAAATLQPSSSASDRIQQETEGSQLNWFEAQAKEKSDSKPKPMISVAVGPVPEDNKCFVCQEKLDEFYHEESDEWHLKDAVRVDGIAFHRLCHQDHLSKEETWNNAFGL